MTKCCDSSSSSSCSSSSSSSYCCDSSSSSCSSSSSSSCSSSSSSSSSSGCQKMNNTPDQGFSVVFGFRCGCPDILTLCPGQSAVLAAWTKKWCNGYIKKFKKCSKGYKGYQHPYGCYGSGPCGNWLVPSGYAYNQLGCYGAGAWGSGGGALYGNNCNRKFNYCPGFKVPCKGKYIVNANIVAQLDGFDEEATNNFCNVPFLQLVDGKGRVYMSAVPSSLGNVNGLASFIINGTFKFSRKTCLYLRIRNCGTGTITIFEDICNNFNSWSVQRLY